MPRRLRAQSVEPVWRGKTLDVDAQPEDTSMANGDGTTGVTVDAATTTRGGSGGSSRKRPYDAQVQQMPQTYRGISPAFLVRHHSQDDFASKISGL